MDPVKERNFHKSKDSSLKLTLILKRIRILHYLVLIITKFSIALIQLILRKQSYDSKRLLIICLHRLGDTVFCIPAIKGIYDCYKEYEIFILCYPESKNILEIKFESENIITIEKSDFFLQRRIAKKNCRKTVNDLKPEIIFDLTGNPASASLILNSGARKIIGTNLVYFEYLYSTFVPIRTSPHYIDIYIDVLKSVKPHYTGYSYAFKSNFSLTDKILIHPFAIRKAKEWGLQKFIELADRLNNRYKVCIISPPNFIEYDILIEMKSLGLEIQITNTVDELIEKTKEACLFISNDSGPSYIANLLGKPIFTIYGPTNPKFSLPFGENHRYFQKELSCSAKEEKVCFTLGGINCPSYECLNQITVDQIEDSINSFIELLGIKENNNNQVIVN
ncbi:MAG: glycosyltransferase family 9 protein [Bacteroidetes bacterium]|nr:glycosyltransferase family 9 protein [Bacteroidota bacterium]